MKTLPAVSIALFTQFFIDASSAAERVDTIDLPTVLRLAGAQNLDVQLARERLAEAVAAHDSARMQFFPWLSPGIGYRRHDGRLQNTEGDLLDVDKQAYNPAATIILQLDLGEAIYKKLAAKQLVRAAGSALDAQRRQSIATAAAAYFDLGYARASIGIAADAVKLSADHEGQLMRAIETGIARKGDLLRVSVQTARNRQAQRQTEEQERLASTRLAQVLHLDPSVILRARDGELVPLRLIEGQPHLASLLQNALATRPELLQGAALTDAADAQRKAAIYGPLIPTIGAQASFGGLGGGRGGDTGNFGGQQDYFIGLGWRIGPGGLFDRSRRDGAEARLRATQIATSQTRDAISREVMDAATRLQSQRDQTAMARDTLAAASEAQKLAEERKEFGVASVLERILAEQDLTRARLEYFQAIAGQNKAQFELQRATGATGRETTSERTRTP